MRVCGPRIHHYTDPRYSVNLSLVLAKGDEERAQRLRATALWTIALHGSEGLPTPPFYQQQKQT